MSKTDEKVSTEQEKPSIIGGVSKRCICCSTEIPPIDYSGGDTPWTGMWNGGIVDRIAANYGSIFDENIYVIAVCDSCIKQKEAEGIVHYTSNYMQ